MRYLVVEKSLINSCRAGKQRIAVMSQSAEYNERANNGISNPILVPLLGPLVKKISPWCILIVRFEMLLTARIDQFPQLRVQVLPGRLKSWHGRHRRRGCNSHLGRS